MHTALFLHGGQMPKKKPKKKDQRSEKVPRYLPNVTIQLWEDTELRDEANSLDIFNRLVHAAVYSSENRRLIMLILNNEGEQQHLTLTQIAETIKKTRGLKNPPNLAREVQNLVSLGLVKTQYAIHEGKRYKVLTPRVKITEEYYDAKTLYT